MIKLCVIGAGEHCRLFHLPALAACRDRAEDVALEGICDLQLERAQEAARTFGFARSFGRPEEMIDAVRPNACLIIAPVTTTAPLALRLLRDGCAVLVEKPLGTTVAFASDFVAAVAETKGRAMVSMNRRFDPMTTAARQWIGARKIEFIRATMRRERRLEPLFFSETALHLVDAVRAIGGEVTTVERHARLIAGAVWWTLRLQFQEGGSALVDIQPTGGENREFIEFYGDGFSAEARSSEFDAGIWQGWEGGSLVASGTTRGWVPYEANGTYAETLAFLETARRRRDPFPEPKDVLPSVMLCDATAASLRVVLV